MFLLHEETHQQMDSTRSKFFWGSDGVKFKYHMIKWENTCLPKDFGGAGIVNTRVLNEALILKWVWRLKNGGRDDRCCELLRNKYLRNKKLATCSGKGGSQFWQGLCKVKHKIEWGARQEVNNGKDTLFWEDVWLGEVPLKLIFPQIYTYCRDKNCTVNECWEEGMENDACEISVTRGRGGNGKT